MANTVIGSTIVIDGEITGDEDLTIRGTVKGKISLSASLIVENSGVVEADIETKHVEVSGNVIGNITANDNVELKAHGHMVGDIKAPCILIADGEDQFGLGDVLPIHCSHCHGSNDIPATAGDRNFQAQPIPGHDLLSKLRVLHATQQHLGIRQQQRRHLSKRFDHQDTGHQRRARKVALEELFVYRDVLDRDNAAARLILGDVINEK